MKAEVCIAEENQRHLCIHENFLVVGEDCSTARGFALVLWGCGGLGYCLAGDGRFFNKGQIGDITAGEDAGSR